MTLIFFCALGFFLKKRLLHFLRWMQQDDYDARRFFRWVIEKKAFDRKGTTALFFALLLSFVIEPWIALLCGGAALCLISFQEEDPRKRGKLCLKMTARATRIFYTAFALFAFFALLVAAFNPVPFFEGILLIQMAPLFLIGALFLLAPAEKKRQQAFLQEAKTKLQEVNPFVIGITGSYGKTSTKRALVDILNITCGPAFAPQKGVNTPMGVTREIREQLKKEHEYAVVEMAAYGKGSIARLCALTPPDAAIITCIGMAHLERFGSQETIYATKKELADAVPEGGILVCNGDNSGARRIGESHPQKKVFFYGEDLTLGTLDCILSHAKLSGEGTAFTFLWQGTPYHGWMPAYGKAALSNAMAAFTMAVVLGADPEFVLAALHSQQPVDNRLKPKKEGGVTYLHDAYNSNPTGFLDALEVMRQLPGKRRILVTPGMIELGERQKSENAKIAANAADICDRVFIVGETNREALLEGLKEKNYAEEHIFLHDTRDSAFEMLARISLEDDIILIENDLPDLYETTLKL